MLTEFSSCSSELIHLRASCYMQSMPWIYWMLTTLIRTNTSISEAFFTSCWRLIPLLRLRYQALPTAFTTARIGLTWNNTDWHSSCVCFLAFRPCYFIQGAVFSCPPYFKCIRAQQCIQDSLCRSKAQAAQYPENRWTAPSNLLLLQQTYLL